MVHVRMEVHGETRGCGEKVIKRETWEALVRLTCSVQPDFHAWTLIAISAHSYRYQT